MASPPPSRPASSHVLRSQRYGAATACAVGLLGLLVVTARVRNIDLLKHFAPSLNSMNPLTAFTFAFTGLALWLLRDEHNQARKRLARWPAALVLSIGLAKLIDAIAGVGVIPAVMSPNAAGCFTLLGSALLLTSRARQGRWMHQQWPLIPILVITLFAFVGYVYQDPRMYNFRNFAPMSFFAALLFLMSCASLLMLRPDSGVMRLITSESAGGTSARLLLSPGILLPVILGRLLFGGKHDAGFDFETNVAVMVVLMVVVQTCLVMANAYWLFRLDASRRRADLALEERIQRERDNALVTHQLAELDSIIRSLRNDLRNAPQQILSKLAGNVGALQGCLYQSAGSGTTRRLRVLAAYAAGSIEQLQQDIRWGEGLAGQCASERKLRMIDDIPAGYWRIRSGMVDALPRTLAFMPIQLDDEVLGVIELASLETFSEAQLDFLRKAAGIMAYALLRLRMDTLTARQLHGQQAEGEPA